MERRGRPDEVVREIGPPEVFKIKRPELPAQPLRPGQLFPVLEVLEELRPTFGEVVTSDNIIEKKLPLVVTVCDHFTVFRLLEPFEVFIEVNPNDAFESPQDGLVARFGRPIHSGPPSASAARGLP